MLGPVTSGTRSAVGRSATSLGMNASRGIIRSITGWRHSREHEVEPVVHLGPHVAVRPRPLSASAVHTSSRASTRAVRWIRRDGLRRPGRASAPNSSASRIRHPLLGAQHLGLVVLELGRHVALGGGEGLPPLVVGGDPGGVRVGDLEVVAEDLVEADLERRDPGPLPLPLLQRGDVLPPAVPERAAARRARRRSPAGSRRRRRAAREAARSSAAGELAGEIGQQVELVDGVGQRGRAPPPGARRGERARAPRRHRAAGGTSRAGRRARAGGAARRGAAGQALEVPHAVERLPQAARGPGRRAPRPPPRRAASPIAAGSRSGESSHCRSSRAPIGVTVASIVSSSVSPRAPAPERLDQLEVSPGHLVEPEERVAAGAPRAAPGAAARPAAARRGSGAARRPRRRRRVVGVPTPSPSSVRERNRRASSSRASSGSNSQRSRTVRSARGDRAGSVRVAGDDHFGRGEPAERLGQAAGRDRISSTNSPVLRSMAASPSRASARRHRHHPVVAPAGDPAFLQHARRASRVSTTSRRTRPLASFGSSTCSQIATRCPAPTSCRRYSAAAFTGTPASGHAVAAGGERDVEHPRGELGVLEEHLVEVAHPEKQDRVAVARLDLPVLDQQRGVFGERDAHGTRTTNGWAPTFARISAAGHVGLAPARKGPTRSLISPASLTTIAV